MNKLYKWLFGFVFVVIAAAAGFTFTVKEGYSTIILRFGKAVNVHTHAGLFFKFPWPIDNLITYDTRNQYMDSGYNETLTNDKINIILQTYIIWRVEDAAKFHTSIGNFETAQRHINDLAASAKNGVLGNYTLSSLVSINSENIKLDEINAAIEEKIAQTAIDNYGISIQALRIKRLALPDSNLYSVFDQMSAERRKFVSQYISEGNRDAAIIVSEAAARASEIIAQGRLEASQIDAETERLIAGIYSDAYNMNSRLFVFLKKLIALENSVNPDTVLIMRAGESPFDIITGMN